MFILNLWHLIVDRKCRVHDADIRLHDLQSEGLPRRLCIDFVHTAGGGTITKQQAASMWDQTILPYGKKMGMLTGYVKAQAGTSKRTAAGAVELQKIWHETVDDLFGQAEKKAEELLVERALVERMLPWLVVNLDEENLNAMGKNFKVVGAKGKRKHDNQNTTSRFVFVAAPILTCS